MAIVVAVTHNEGLGDYIFALKYAAGLRKKLFLETGRLEDVIIATDREGVSLIRKIKGDSEYQLNVVTPDSLNRLCQQGMTIDLLIEAPTKSAPLLKEIDKKLPENHPDIPYYHISEYQFPDLSRGHPDTGKLKQKGTFTSGFKVPPSKRRPNSKDFSGVLRSPEIDVGDDLEKKEHLFQALSGPIRDQLLKGEQEASFEEFKAKNQLAIQYSHEDHESPSFKANGDPMYPCEIFLRTYFASIALAEDPKKNQQIILVGKSIEAKKSAARESLEDMRNKGYKKIVIIDGSTGEEETLCDEGDGPVVKLFLQKSMPHQDMMTFFALSERKISGITGDQSLGEALSASMIVIYERLHHKQDLEKALVSNLKDNIRKIAPMFTTMNIPDKSSMTNLLKKHNKIDQSLTPDRNLYEIEIAYANLLIDKSHELIDLLSKRVPTDKDFDRMGELFQVPGLYSLVIKAHGQTAKGNDLIEGTAHLLTEHLTEVSRKEKADVNHDTFIFQIISGQEVECIHALGGISNIQLCKLITSRTLFQLLEHKGMDELSELILQRFIADPESCKTLVLNKIKAVDVSTCTKEEIETLYKITECLSIKELRALDLSSIGIPSAITEKLPEDLDIDSIKNLISTHVKDRILQKKDEYFTQHYNQADAVNILLSDDSEAIRNLDICPDRKGLPVSLSLLLPEDAQIVLTEIRKEFEISLKKKSIQILENIESNPSSLSCELISKLMNDEELPDEFFSLIERDKKLLHITKTTLSKNLTIESVRESIHKGLVAKYTNFLSDAEKLSKSSEVMSAWRIEEYIKILETDKGPSNSVLAFLLEHDEEKSSKLKEASQKIIKTQLILHVKKITPAQIKENPEAIERIKKVTSLQDVSDADLKALSIPVELVRLSGLRDITVLKKTLEKGEKLHTTLDTKLRRYKSVSSKLQLSDFSQFKAFKKKYNAKMSDVVKKEILSDLKGLLDTVESIEDLDKVERHFKKSPESMLISRHSRLLSRVFSSDKTNAEKLADEMFADVRSHLDSKLSI
jgi:hypothetical protein